MLNLSTTELVYKIRMLVGIAGFTSFLFLIPIGFAWGVCRETCDVATILHYSAFSLFLVAIIGTPTGIILKTIIEPRLSDDKIVQESGSQ